MKAVLAYVLADAVLGTVWAGAAQLSVSSLVAVGSAATHLPAWPYALAGSPSERLRLWLEAARQRYRVDAVWAGAVGGLIFGSASALLLAVLMGATVSRLVLLALVLAVLGASSRSGPAGQARLGALLPMFFAWLVAHAALGSLGFNAIALAALYAFVVYTYAMIAGADRWQRWASLGNFTQLLVVMLLAFWGRPLYAGVAGLLLAGQWLLQSALSEAPLSEAPTFGAGARLLYWRWSGLFLLASMVVAALGCAR